MAGLLVITAGLLVVGCSGSIAQPPERKVFHVCDWHYVAKELFAADLRSTPGQSYSDEEIEKLYAAHLDDVEAVQNEQVELIKELIREHQLQHVWVEGLTANDKPAFLELVKQAKAVEIKQVPLLRERLREVEGILRGMNQTGTGDYQKMKAIQTRTQSLLTEQRERMLQVGAAGKLLMAGELADVVPLDDDETLAAAHPVKADGTVQLEPEKIEAREAAMVTRLATADEPVSVIVLGTAHELADHFKGRSTVYERVATPSVPEVAEK